MTHQHFSDTQLSDKDVQLSVQQIHLIRLNMSPKQVWPKTTTGRIVMWKNQHHVNFTGSTGENKCDVTHGKK